MSKTRKQTIATVANVVAVAMLALGASATAQAQSTSCLVVGERTARVSTPQGERSPVFLATACDRLKLVSGNAQASWIARDGKPRIVPITPQGVADSPQAGAEERSVNVVWGELTTRREKAQPAYMRSFGVDRPPRVYIPADGLVVVEKSDGRSVVTLSALTETGTTPAADMVVSAGQPVTLSRNQAAAGSGLAVQVRRGDLVEEWRWTIVPADESARIDARIAEIDAAIADPEQRQLTQAMLFEQLKLHTNMDLLLQGVRARRGAGEGLPAAD